MPYTQVPMNEDMTNKYTQRGIADFDYEELTPEDSRFIDYINRKINRGSAIGVTLTYTSIIDEILESARYFWEWHPDATVIERLGIRMTDIIPAQQYDGCARLQLPEFVESIRRQYTANLGFGGIVNELFKIGMLRSYLFRQESGVTVSSGFSNFRPSDGLLSMYEVQNLQSKFARFPQFTFTKANGTLTIRGKVETDLVYDIYRRLPFEHLYNLQDFIDYVAAKCKMNFAGIVMTFGFTMPNGVSINYEKLEKDGEAMVEKIEAKIAKMQTSPMVVKV